MDDRSEQIAQLARRALAMVGVFPVAVTAQRYRTGDATHLDRYVVGIEHADRDEGVGCYYPFTSPQRDGYWTNLVYGYVRGVLLERDGVTISLAIDAFATVESTPRAPRYAAMELNVGVAEGLVVRNGRLDREMRLAGASTLLIANGVIVGPSVAMLRVARAMGRAYAGDVLFDLFAGSASLSVAALNSGAGRVRAIDSLPVTDDVKVPRVDRVQCDLYNLVEAGRSLAGGASAAMLDPFDIDAMRAIPLLATVLQFTPTAVLHLGSAERAQWNGNCLQAARRLMPSATCSLVGVGDDVVILATVDERSTGFRSLSRRLAAGTSF